MGSLKNSCVVLSIFLLYESRLDVSSFDVSYICLLSWQLKTDSSACFAAIGILIVTDGMLVSSEISFAISFWLYSTMLSYDFRGDLHLA